MATARVTSMSDRGLDMVLRGGRVVDPAQNRDGVFDVGIKDGKIAAVQHDLGDVGGAKVVNVKGKLVTPGLIDTHAHVYQYVTGKFGLNADLCGIRSGATTLVDQGGPSLMTIPGFRRYVVEPSKSNVLAFISAYVIGGMEGHYYVDLYGPSGIDVEKTIESAIANRDIVKGVKGHAEIGGASRWGLESLKLAMKIARGADIPLYVHLGQLWPTKDGEHIDADALMREFVPMMQPGDILAHPFTRHPGGFISEETGEVHPVVRAALDRGVRVDVGHGSHFSFEMARRVLAAGIKPDTLGADLHGYNVTVPDETKTQDTLEHLFFGAAPFSLCHAMTELLTLGMALPEVVATATSNAASMIHMADELGTLKRGRVADVSVLELMPGKWQLADNSGETVTAREIVVPHFTLRKGVRHKCDAPILPQPVKAAA